MRTTAFLLALAAGILVLCLVAQASAVSPSVWHPLGSQEFSAVPGWSGGLGPAPEVIGSPPSWPSRPTPSQNSPSAPTAAPGRTPRPTPSRAPRTYFDQSASGSASFYAYVPGGAAAAARLRDAIGPDWRGKTVTVWYGTRHVVVVLSDYETSLIPGRLIDLNETSFAQLVGPGWYQRGRVTVRVKW